jgi:hypothetical protein
VIGLRREPRFDKIARSDFGSNLNVSRIGAEIFVVLNNYGGRSSVGRAPDCDSGRRGFESRRPPQFACIVESEYSGWRELIFSAELLLVN